MKHLLESEWWDFRIHDAFGEGMKLQDDPEAFREWAGRHPREFLEVLAAYLDKY